MKRVENKKSKKSLLDICKLICMMSIVLSLTSCLTDDDAGGTDPNYGTEYFHLEVGDNGNLVSSSSYYLTGNQFENKMIISIDIEEQLDYLIKIQHEDIKLTLKDDNGNLIATGNGILTNKSPYEAIPSGLELPLGRVFLEVENMNGGLKEGQLKIILLNEEYTIHIGDIKYPIHRGIDIGMYDHPTDTYRLKFHLSYQTALYNFEIPNYPFVLLNNSEEVVANSVTNATGKSGISGDVLEPGEYTLVFSNSHPYADSEERLDFQIFPNTDIDLGMVEAPFSESFLPEFEETEIVLDNKIVYSFSIQEPFLIDVSTWSHNYSHQLIFRNAQGDILASVDSVQGDTSLWYNSFTNATTTSNQTSLPPGEYFIEFVNSSNQPNPGFIKIKLDKV